MPLHTPRFYIVGFVVEADKCYWLVYNIFVVLFYLTWFFLLLMIHDNTVTYFRTKPFQQPTYSISNHFHIDIKYCYVFARLWFAEIGCKLGSLGLCLDLQFQNMGEKNSIEKGIFPINVIVLMCSIITLFVVQKCTNLAPNHDIFVL